jgi:fibronectin type 3 domain-containing protein
MDDEVVHYGSITIVVLDDLKPGTDYTYRVMVTNLVGDSELSNMYTFQMVEAPSQPLKLRVTEFSDTHVSLAWKQPLSTGG